MRIERIVRPPELPRHKKRKRVDIATMSTLYFGALIVFLALVLLTSWFALSGPDPALLVLAVMGLVATYVVLGGTLCALFLRRLAWWNDASLEDAVRAKMSFIWSWPWAAGRLLSLLMLYHIFA